MKDLKLENASRGLCVVCGNPTYTSNSLRMQCGKCHRTCKPVNIEGNTANAVMSDCCNADVLFVGCITCSPVCHEEFVIAAEKEFGMFKKVVDGTTNIAYKIPTRDIVEKGLVCADLPRYPVWDGEIGKDERN
jgi:ribosomal protein S27AE